MCSACFSIILLHIALHPEKDEQAPYSVLDAHHATNRKHRVPNSKDLTQAHRHQSNTVFETQPRSCCPPGQSADKLNDSEGDGNNKDEDKDSGKKPAPKKHATRNSNETSEPTPRQMGFYRHSPAWTNILKSLKHEY
jgi:hypothetical protein